MNYEARRRKLRLATKKVGAEALLVTNFHNVTYLTGFTGDDSYLLLLATGEVMISDGRYTTQLKEECPGLETSIRRPGVTILEATLKGLQAAGIGRLAIEAQTMTVSFREELGEKLPKLQIISTSDLVETLRMVKDRDEIAWTRKAITCAESAFEAWRSGLRPEMTEKEAADELDHQLRLFGAKQSAFPPIVAVGPRAALPHAVPTDRRLGDGELILVDWGASRLYNSDLTRVILTGRISPKLRRVYEVVLGAQMAAIDAIRPETVAREVDHAARSVIEAAGFGRRFSHGLGHGLGLEVHEAPKMHAKCEVVLRPGMIVTVEPGVYLPGWGGVRIEDDVLVTRTGREVLTSLPKRLEDLPASGNW
jgi:Xaa-Pro aminopeptidase